MQENSRKALSSPQGLTFWVGALRITEIGYPEPHSSSNARPEPVVEDTMVAKLLPRVGSMDFD